MNKINWVRKLTSRKLWVAVVGLVSSLLIAFGASQDVATQVAGVIMAGATCIAYIVGEGLVDYGRNKEGEKEEEVPTGFDDFVEEEITEINEE